MSEALYPYYERELLFIRQLAQEFARQYPAAAGRLLLEPGRSGDPHIERRRKSILAEAIENQPTSEADPDSFSEAPYPDPPKLEDVIKSHRPQPDKRTVMPKSDRDRPSRDKPTKSQRPTKPKLSIVKSDDEPLA